MDMQEQVKVAQSEPGRVVEMASVLFMDIVNYSSRPMDQQSRAVTQLQKIVRKTAQFNRANSTPDGLLSLPTGDGMAIVFFHDPIAPIECAVEIARALKKERSLSIRMGVHSGPIYRHADIRDELNVVGGGINIAQRVMDCGDAGHILVSQAVAEVLGQLSNWSGHVHDLGECTVKHGATVHLYNLFTEEIGNPASPIKVREMRRSRSWFGGLVWYCLPPLVITLLVRVFLDTSPVTRERPLTGSETLVVFAVLFVLTVLLLRLKSSIVKRFH